jgi:hypothetical protein
MAELAKKQLRKKIPELELALEGKVEEHLSLSKMLSGVNVFEISDIQEDETEAPGSDRSECNAL